MWRVAPRAMAAAWLVVCLCLLLACQADARKPTAQDFAKAAHASSKGYIELGNSGEFDALVASPRDYSMSLLLSAVDSPPVECGPCKIFHPRYEALAKGYRKTVSASVKKDGIQHIFAYLEFKNGRETFQKLKLQYAPVLLFFPPTTGPRASPIAEPEQYDFNRLGFEGEDVAADLSKRIGVRIPYSKPFPWQLAAAAFSGSAVIVLLFVFVFPRLSRAVAGGEADHLLSPKVVFKFIIEAAVLATIIVMCAGHMWNGIRNAPYITVDNAGRPQYFVGGFSNQNAAETQIISVIYGVLAFSVVSLAVLVPMQRDPVRQRAGVYVWSAILLSAFSLLLYVFRIKNASYPFRLFF